MRQLYTDLNIQFTIEQTDFYALNIVFERFLRTIPNHSHGSNSYEIHYIPSGYGHVKINQELYDIVPNTLYITGPHVEHAQTPVPDDPMCEYCVYLKAGKQKGKGASLLPLFTQTAFWFGPDQQNIHGIMQQIFFELENQYTGYKEQVQSLLTQLIVHIVRNYEMKQKALDHFEPSNLQDSKYIILEEYFLYEYQNLSLDDLAERLSLSRRQTERLLKEHYGKTFLQKKTEAKMAAAAILLGDKDRSIASIAEELGYSSTEHFSAAFKRYYQMSAREYRKRS
ncbi:MAG: AraC family transcriptional regulator [Lachnospiraceae bacterium]|nr:AraC family transcriptional regulator [Lachnospiraceae bacterium]